MAGKIVITGTGIISAAGRNTEETLKNLCSGRYGIGPVTVLDTRHKEMPVGEVRLTNEQLHESAETGTSGEVFSRTTLLGIIAAKEAALMAKVSETPGKRTGFISATTVGGMCENEKYFTSLLSCESEKKHVESFDIGNSAELIACQLGINHYVTTVNTACSSSANALALGARLIRNGLLDRVIAGGTDALSRFTLNGFHALEILDNNHCRPFDRDRKGLNLGEGAAYVVLEPDQSAGRHICELAGYGNTNDAYHPTASSPEGKGAFLAMKKALDCAGLKPGDIDYLNAHGTGTQINDLSEGRAIENLFGNDIPPVSSTKSFTGHTLGASGSIEAVVSILALKNEIIFPTIGLVNPMCELSFKAINKLMRSVKIKNVMSNSFGFGGNCTTLIFSEK
ncbi:MAG: beta-ketoacyl-[acyl-carrier-protein] synthase family protein [Bacteroidetes bacterium]|nr:beta-ketoacyl-[acyl-carrier-protein] synthase family protein [Bacteroidota bacterium]